MGPFRTFTRVITFQDARVENIYHLKEHGCLYVVEDLATSFVCMTIPLFQMYYACQINNCTQFTEFSAEKLLPHYRRFNQHGFGFNNHQKTFLVLFAFLQNCKAAYSFGSDDRDRGRGRLGQGVSILIISQADLPAPIC